MTVPGDPRLTAADGEVPLRADMRPRVAARPRGPSGLLIGFGMAVLAIVLFAVLNTRRQALEAPQVRARSADGDTALARAVPPLYVPAAPLAVPANTVPAPAPTPTFVLPTPPSAPPRVVYVPQPAAPAAPAAVSPADYPPPASLPQPPAGAQAVERSGSGVLVIDATSGPGGDGAPGAAPTQGRDGPASFLGLNGINGLGGLNGSANTARASAGVIPNRGTTVAQGTLIPAVLETALDSTRPGFARAIVSRDVRGFDGTRILIPRGSRVFGEYLANAAAGQNRATINWTRLVRPDGVTIAIASPAADALGRGGVKARVNSHFFARFGAAILQSALQVGVNLASRPADGSVVLALPGQTNGLGNGLFGNQNQPVPTLTIRAGTSITIFAARDLDFTGFGTAR